MTAARNKIDWTDPAIRAARLAIGYEFSLESDLARIVERAEPRSDETALDYVTGLGYVARAFAPHVKKVDAFDPDGEVLGEAKSLAANAGIGNIDFEVADPTQVPYGEKSFDIVTARLALRHACNAHDCLDEIARVLKLSGRLMIADSLAPQHAELAAFQREIMTQRDRSHVSSLSLAEWETLLENRGFSIDEVEIYPKEHDFEAWATRLGADSDSVRMLAMMLHNSTTRARRHFRIIEAEGKPVSFVTWMILIRARIDSAREA
jgi:ubiquinone/menaquinone biosynthesis C-methylase UbiE